jgi:hypothetical protein
MNTQTRNKVLTLSLAVVALLGTVACSSQQGATLNYGTGSTGFITGGAGYNSAGQALASCSASTSAVADFNMSLENYTMGGSTYNNWIRIRFNAFPANFTNSSALLTFWAYGTDSYGNFTGMVQVPFFVEKYSGIGSYTQISQSAYSLSWATMQTLASQNGGSSASGNLAVETMDFVIQLDNYPNATVIDAALYMSGAGDGTYIVNADRYAAGLIPTFLANPNDYAATHPSTLLSLHPFAGLMSSGESESQFEALAQGLCF